MEAGSILRGCAHAQHVGSGIIRFRERLLDHSVGVATPAHVVSIGQGGADTAACTLESRVPKIVGQGMANARNARLTANEVVQRGQSHGGPLSLEERNEGTPGLLVGPRVT